MLTANQARTAVELFIALVKRIRKGRYAEAAAIRRQLQELTGFDVAYRATSQTSEAGQASEFRPRRRLQGAVEHGSDYQKSEPAEATTPRPALDSQPCVGGRNLAKLCDE